MFLANLFEKKTRLPEPHDALKGRDNALPTAERHFVNGQPLKGPYPVGAEIIYFGMGCFWGAERLFWKTEGVHVTAAGYQGGYTPNPTYQETCTGQTGHAETVMVVFDPATVALARLLALFWEEHDPTQGMRQGNDVGTTYRSAIYATTAAQLEAAQTSREACQAALKAANRNAAITTEIRMAPEFYFAEEYHQQYLAKNPGGYCGLQGTGITCPGS
ncbi:peptide-methionine (S)-S-oxide reductase MsrA [Oricola sp.]|uniref:peptide-methionine (S)-S-oxide reductase MsrA n=1 Tax=Oricola sp. TaxID=1979950 RepID=UPI003BAA9383